MISKAEQQQIKGLIQTQGWQTAQRYAELLIAKIQDSSPVRDTEWETIKTLLINEGKVQGIRDFISNLYNEAQKS